MMIQRDEWEQTMTKLKKVQKENELLRGQLDMVQREADYWEYKAKQFEAQLALWKGTAP